MGGFSWPGVWLGRIGRLGLFSSSIVRVLQVYMFGYLRESLDDYVMRDCIEIVCLLLLWCWVLCGVRVKRGGQSVGLVVSLI